MRVKVLRPFLNGATMVDIGEEIAVSESRGQDLERNGLVTPTIGGMMARGGPEAAKGGAVDPIVSRPAGGPTGGETPASLSRRGRRRARLGLMQGEVVRGS